MLTIKAQTAFEHGGEKGEMFYPIQSGMLEAMIGKLQEKIEYALNALEEIEDPDDKTLSAISELQVAKKAVIHALNDVAASEAGQSGRLDLPTVPPLSWSRTRKVPAEEQIQGREDLFSRRAK